MLQYNIRGVPMLGYYAPTTTTGHSKSALPPMFMEEVQDAEKMAAFVRGYTGINVRAARVLLRVLLHGTMALPCCLCRLRCTAPPSPASSALPS